MEGGGAWHTGQSSFVGSQKGILKGKFYLGSASHSPPVIGVGGIVYLGIGVGPFIAVSPDTIAQSKTDHYWVYEGPSDAKGHWSVPAIGADGVIYVGGENGGLFALEKGKLKWRYPESNWLIGSPVIAADGTIYINMNKGSMEKPNWHLLAFDPSSALGVIEPKWVSSFATGKTQGTSPAIGPDGTIYIATEEGILFAIGPDGKYKWQFLAGKYIGTSPVIGHDGTIYTLALSDIGPPKLHALNPYAVDDTSRLKWSRPLPPENTLSILFVIDANGTAYVDGNKKLYAINLSSISLEWNLVKECSVTAPPVIGADGTIYVGCADKNIYALNPDGTEKWHFETGGYVRSCVIAADGTVYVGSEDEYLYAFGD
jgi:outer membrane protein assembly factor BamB